MFFHEGWRLFLDFGTSLINRKFLQVLSIVKLFQVSDIQRQAALHDCLPRLLGDGVTQIEL